MAIASLIIGVIIIILLTYAYIPWVEPIGVLKVIGAYITVPIGIVGLILGILALKRKARRTIAITAIVLNSLPILFNCLYTTDSRDYWSAG